MAALSCGTSWMGFPLKYVELFLLSTCQNSSWSIGSIIRISAAVTTNGHKSVLRCVGLPLTQPENHLFLAVIECGNWCLCRCRNSWWCRIFWGKRWDMNWHTNFATCCSSESGVALRQCAAVCDTPIGIDMTAWKRGLLTVLLLPFSAK